MVVQIDDKVKEEEEGVVGVASCFSIFSFLPTPSCRVSLDRAFKDIFEVLRYILRRFSVLGHLLENIFGEK